MTWETLVNQTVGYNECEHKEAFMLGAHIMHNKLSVELQRKIDGLYKTIDYYQNLAKRKQEDLRTIADILHRAREE